MENGYSIVTFDEIKRDEQNEQIVKDVSYTVVANLGMNYSEEEVFKICNENKFKHEIIMIVKVENGKVSKCCNMVFPTEYEETDKIEWWLDCCEWDFRVYASVAFNNDELV